MATGLTEKIRNMGVGALLYLVVGVIIAISQDYWDFTQWDGHVVTSALTALIATLLWPVAIFYHVALIAR